MVKDINSIFGSITPENIKDIPVIKDAMATFIETLEELSKESIDIKNIYENDNIREELSKIYLDDLYHVLKAVESNQHLIDAIDSVNASYNPPGKDPSDEDYISFLRRDAITNISKYITDEHFLSFRSYKENKGKKQAIKYIYELLNIFANNGLAQLDFRIDEGDEPFHLDIQGTLPKEFYEYIIYPLAHPLGFTYTYERFMSLLLEDYFPEMAITYDVQLLRIVCLKNDGSVDYDYYIVRDYADQVKLNQVGIANRVVTEIKTYLEIDSRIKEIYFEDGEYLKQVTTRYGQTYTYRYNSLDELLFTYPNQCSIEIIYTYDVKTTVTDDEYDTQARTNWDYFARLDYSNSTPTIGIPVNEDGLTTTLYTQDQIITDAPTTGEVDLGFYITGDATVSTTPEAGLHLFDTGYNDRLDEDGNYLLTPNNTEGRLEHYFAPSAISDLKILTGQYEYDYKVKDANGNTVYTQPLKYTETINTSFQILDWVPAVTTYIKQNIGNNDYIAHELLIDKQSFNVAAGAYGEGVYIEPIHAATTNYIDANGVDRGALPGSLNYITESDRSIGDLYTIGGYYDEYDYDPGNLTAKFNPNQWNNYIETIVDADPVNLQYNTFDIIGINETVNFEIDEFGIALDSDNVFLTIHTDSFGYDFFNIEETYAIINNADGSYGSFEVGDGTYITGIQHPITESEATFITIDTDVNALYEYCTFKDCFNADALNPDFIGDDFDPTYIGGINYSEVVHAEVYLAAWNTGENYEEREPIYINTNYSVLDFFDQDGTGSHEITETSSNKTYGALIDDFRFDEMWIRIADEIQDPDGSFLIGEDGKYIYGMIHEILENITAILRFNVVVDEQSHTELDDSAEWFEQIASENFGFIIGDGWIYYKTKEVITNLSESYTSLGLFDQRSDDEFDFGVFRNGVRLTDNNLAAVA